MARVYIVGAGPGDKGLISVKGMNCIKNADLIVYDRLVDENILLNAKKECKMIYVGKESSNHTMKQEEINQILVDFAKKNINVVRLKGGDPYVFGRGSEEIEALINSDVDFEVVPGITSAIGGLAYAGIPVTSRGISSALHIITGNGKNSTDVDVDWEVLGKARGTIVFLMGIANIENIASKLIENGKSPDTPVAFVSWATWYNQKTHETTLENAVQVAKKEKIKAPSIFVVGDVVRLRKKLSYIENMPLHSKTIALTRDVKQSLTWAEKIENLGARALVLPSIKIERKVVDLENVTVNGRGVFDGYDCIAFTSPNGVKYFMENMRDFGVDMRNLHGIKIASLNYATRNSIESYGIYPDIVSEESYASSLASAIVNARIKNVLLIGSNLSGKDLKDNLENYGIDLGILPVYTNEQNIAYYPKIREKIVNEQIDYMIFASASSVESIVRAIEDDRVSSISVDSFRDKREVCIQFKNIKTVAIGDTTARAMNNLGIDTDIVADEPRIERILGLIKDDIERGTN